MINIMDTNKQLQVWVDKIRLGGDWNIMTLAERRGLVSRFKSVISEMIGLDISDKDLIELLVATDQFTVWEAAVSLYYSTLNNPDLGKKYRLLAIFKKGVLGIWKSQHPINLTWQPRDTIKKTKRRVASSAVVQRYHPLNYLKKRCMICHDKLNKTNQTGICSACQQKRKTSRGEMDEHESECKS